MFRVSKINVNENIHQKIISKGKNPTEYAGLRKIFGL